MPFWCRSAPRQVPAALMAWMMALCCFPASGAFLQPTSTMCSPPCQQGYKSVVRLKGGDPAVFSRASSEAAALANARIPFEFVPGVSSALAAPLLAGFPLTDARLGSSFAVVSGHDVEGIDWDAFSRIPTLVILMAGRGLPRIVQKLLALGRQASTPVAVVHAAGLLKQRVWRSTLGCLVQDTEDQDLSPCVVVVGDVAGLPAAWQSTVPAALND